MNFPDENTIIPALLENGLFITDFSEKAQILNEYFILQCTAIDTGSELPQDTPPPTSLISDFPISDEKILNITRSLNPNKAHGRDEISVIFHIPAKVCEFNGNTILSNLMES